MTINRKKHIPFFSSADHIVLSGRVIKGDGHGRKLGFPTANIDRREYQHRKLKIRFGIYAGFVELALKAKSYKLYKAAIVIGPLDKKGLPKLEAHLIGYTGDLYGKRLEMNLIKYLRPFRKYKNVKDLKDQIRKDVEQIKQLK